MNKMKFPLHEPQIIDQSRLAEENRDRQQRLWPNDFNWLQTFRVHQFDMIDPRKGRFVDRLADNIDNLSR